MFVALTEHCPSCESFPFLRCLLLVSFYHSSTSVFIYVCAWTFISLYISHSFLLSVSVFRFWFSDCRCCLLYVYISFSTFQSDFRVFSFVYVCVWLLVSVTVAPFSYVSLFCRRRFLFCWFTLIWPLLSRVWSFLWISWKDRAFDPTRTALFCGITQRRIVIRHRRFGAN
jgi:hypothetical protein